MLLSPQQRARLIAALAPEEQQALADLLGMFGDNVVDQLPVNLGQLFNALAEYHRIWPDGGRLGHFGSHQHHEITDIGIRGAGKFDQEID